MPPVRAQNEPLAIRTIQPGDRRVSSWGWGLQRISLTVTNDKGLRHSTCKDFGIEAPALFRRGDSNDDGAADITDAIAILGFLFKSRTDLDNRTLLTGFRAACWPLP